MFKMPMICSRLAWPKEQTRELCYFLSRSQFYLAEPTLKQLLETDDRTNRMEILHQAAKDLPVSCRTMTGGIGCISWNFFFRTA